MPSTPYASVRTSVNGGAAVAGTVVAVADDVITLTTLSTVGWKTSNLPTVWQITAYPDGWVADAGWVLNLGTLYYEYTVGGDTGMLPPPVTMPSAAEIAAGLWGKWKFRLLVNGGGGQLTDWTAGVSVLSQTGLEDIAVYEGREFDSFRAWVGAYQRAARIWDASIAGGIGGGVSLGAGTPAVLTASAGTQGALLTAAPFDHRHQVQTAICVAIGAANNAGSSASLARADHVHAHDNLAGGALHALAVAGVSHGFISATNQSKLDGIEVGAQAVTFAHVKTALGVASSAVDFNGQKITGVAAGVSATDAVNMAQLSALGNGFDLKKECRGASLGNQPLSGALTEDGITYDDDDRYLAKDQSDLTQNGIYVVNTTGAWSRATDADSSDEVTPGMMVFVTNEGTVNGNTGWAILSSAATPLTLGVDDITFTQIFGPGAYVAGAGLTQSGNTFNVGAGAGVQVNANDVAVIYGAGSDLTTVNAGDTASAGSLDKAARADHQHPVSTAAPGTQVLSDASSAQEGSATSLMRSDARLIVTTAAPVSLGTSNQQGNATTLARSNHVHDHGTQSTGNHHAVAIPSGANGFMSGADKQKLDDATSTPTASKIVMWDASNFLFADRFNDTAASISTAGLLNAGRDKTIVAARNHGGTADISLVTTTASDAQQFGDATHGVSADLGASSFVRLMIGAYAGLHATADGVSLGMAPSFGSGTGVLGIANATVVPTGAPTGGALLYVAGTCVSAISDKGLVHQLNARGSSNVTYSARGPINEQAQAVGAVTITAATLPIPSTNCVAVFHVSVTARRASNGTAFFAERLIRASRVAGGAVLDENLTVGTDKDNTGAAPTVAVNPSGNDILVQFNGVGGVTFDVDVDGTYRHYAP